MVTLYRCVVGPGYRRTRMCWNTERALTSYRPMVIETYVTDGGVLGAFESMVEHGDQSRVSRPYVSTTRYKHDQVLNLIL